MLVFDEDWVPGTFCASWDKTDWIGRSLRRCQKSAAHDKFDTRVKQRIKEL
jgi:hypothetical protein